MKELDPTTVESSELVEQTFNFWFNTREHIRSPFPEYIRTDLKKEAINKFYNWASGLNDEAKEEVNDEIIGEKFEEIIFETALTLVLTEDEKITINYPFLPRIGDEIKDQQNTKNGTLSIVIDRSLIKENDHSFLKVKLEKKDSTDRWETKFELPK